MLPSLRAFSSPQPQCKSFSPSWKRIHGEHVLPRVSLLSSVMLPLLDGFLRISHRNLPSPYLYMFLVLSAGGHACPQLVPLPGPCIQTSTCLLKPEFHPDRQLSPVQALHFCPGINLGTAFYTGFSRGVIQFTPKQCVCQHCIPWNLSVSFTLGHTLFLKILFTHQVLTNFTGGGTEAGSEHVKVAGRVSGKEFPPRNISILNSESFPRNAP